MRKLVMVLGVAALVLASAAYVSAGQKNMKGEKGIIIGQAIEVSTYAMQDSDGEGYVDALTNRANQGFPVGILEDETGEFWLVVYRNPAPASGMQTGNAMLAPLMGKKVVAQGLKYKAKGLSVIRMSIVSEY